MKLTVLDGYTVNPGDLSWAPLEKLGEFTVYDRTDPTDEAEILRRIGDAEVICTNKTPLNASVLRKCPKLRLIAVLATGYNVVDCGCARELGIPVCNVPGYGTAAVAQFAIAMLLEICCRVGLHDQSVHEGNWEKSPDFCYWEAPMTELNGKTMGIIGFGRIGQATGAVAKALGMKVLAHSPHESEAGRAIAEYVDLETLLRRSDVISLHCPQFPETEKLICRETLAQMKDGVILLNNSRGGLIDEQALADALHSGKVSAAGLDVVSTEPIRSDNPLLHAPNCILTPHISWAAPECRQRILETTAENIKSWLSGSPIHVVNA